MENKQQQYPTQVPTNQQAATKTKIPKSIWLAMLLFLILTIAGFGLYGTTRLQLSDEKKAHNITKSQLNQEQAKLKTAVSLPDLSNSSPECGSGNNDKMRLALVNKEPIGGYNFYILTCLNEIDNKTSLKGELQAYKVDANGKQTFKFGNGFGEPYCVSKKFLPLDVAVKLNTVSGFPFCSGYYGT